MCKFNEIENAILRKMISSSTNESYILYNQYESADIIKRVNTGSGFYSYINCNGNVQILNQSVICNVFVMVHGLCNPLTCVLFTRDGKIHLLEGASVEESTADIDFSNVEFEIL